MWKKFLVVLAMLYAAASFAAMDVNKASAAELDSIKGIGPGISGKIIDERKKGSFKDWNDFIARIQGVGEGNAAKFSAEGLTVNGSSFKASAATRKDEKSAAKETKAAAKEEKKEAQAAAKEEKKDAKAAAKEKKDAKVAAKDEKTDAKATAAKPAASEPKKAASAKK